MSARMASSSFTVALTASCIVRQTEPGPILTFFTALTTALGSGCEIGNLHDHTQGTFGQVSWVATPFDDCGGPAIVTRTQR